MSLKWIELFAYYFTSHSLPPFHTWVKKEGVARDYIQLLLIKLCCTTLVNEMTHSTFQGIFDFASLLENERT